MKDITLPRLAEGIVDWTQVFDAPETGLVARIEQARSADDLRKAMQLILKTLFNREGDADRRAVFTNLVNEILTSAGKTHKSSAAAMREIKTRVVQILHSIRDDRLKRAQKALAARAQKIAQENRGKPRPASTEALGYNDRQPDEVHIAAPKPARKVAPQADDSDADDTDVDDSGAETPDEPRRDGDPSIGDFDDWLSRPPVSKSVIEYEDTGGGARKMPEEFFSDVIMSSILDNLADIRGPLTDGGGANGKLPFILSPAFAERLEQVLRDHVLPDFAESSYFTISQMSAKPRAKWLAALSAIFADRTQGLMLWERWQIAWRNATTQSDEPPPPKVDPRQQGLRGLMTRLLGDEDHFIPDQEMTEEEWREAVEETRQQNLRARQTWALLTADSDTFIPPVDSDNALLMSLFRANDDLKTHVAKLRSFTADLEQAGRAFDAYLPGKDLDLPLLCACYQYPDELMVGEKAAVSIFVAGLNRLRGQTALPMCCRFLGTALGNRFGDG